MLRRLLCCTFGAFPSVLLAQELPSVLVPSFWEQQLAFPRVRAARQTTWPTVAHRLRTHYLDPQRLELFFRLIKTTHTLEVWARNQRGGAFELLQSYPLAATSGSLGPKRQAGDNQVPEGFYEIDRFNPKSLYHLSLGLNYPNEADRALGELHPGGDIFIHGSNVSIGCMPITDACIEEVYLLAVMARSAGQAVLAVHLFPFPITDAELAKRTGSPDLAFWRGLRAGYEYFEKRHEIADSAALVAKR